MNYAEALASYERELELCGEEAESLSYTFREILGWTMTDLVLHLQRPLTEEHEKLLSFIYQRLAQHEPAQYITGKAYFGKLALAVDKRVLIPRPETEELVDLILRENSRADLAVLDIGTGSGAIALSLKEARPTWQVTASDLSADALTVAKDNADQHQLDVSFVQSDVFSHISGKFDIIVSNPPYISFEDKEEVGVNVLASEPHSALFAEEDGYAIYRQIIEEAQQHLTENGKLYFEIGYKQGQGLRKLLAQHFPEKRVRVLADFFGKDRMVVMDNG